MHKTELWTEFIFDSCLEHRDLRINLVGDTESKIEEVEGGGGTKRFGDWRSHFFLKSKFPRGQ